jgi:hypothetical protein
MATPHRHIDHLLGVAEPVEVWYTRADQKLEHQWGELLENVKRFRVPKGTMPLAIENGLSLRTNHLLFRAGISG